MRDITWLRKGNYIYHDQGPFEFMGEKFTVVEDTKGEYIELNISRQKIITYPLEQGDRETLPVEDAEMIPLNEMWLERFGFRKGTFQQQKGEAITLGVHYTRDQYCIHPSEDGFRLISNKVPTAPMKYVHQLQNAWELTSNDKLDLHHDYQ